MSGLNTRLKLGPSPSLVQEEKEIQRIANRNKFQRCRGKMANALHTHWVLIILCVLVVVDASCVIGQILCDILIIQDKLTSSEQASESLVELLRNKYPEHLNDTKHASLSTILEMLKHHPDWNMTSIDIENEFNIILDKTNLDMATTTRKMTPNSTTQETTTIVVVTNPVQTHGPAVNIGQNVLMNDGIHQPVFVPPKTRAPNIYQPPVSPIRGKVHVNTFEKSQTFQNNNTPVNTNNINAAKPQLYAPPPKTRQQPPNNIPGAPMSEQFVPRPHTPISRKTYPVYNPATRAPPRPKTYAVRPSPPSNIPQTNNRGQQPVVAIQPKVSIPNDISRLHASIAGNFQRVIKPDTRKNTAAPPSRARTPGIRDRTTSVKSITPKIKPVVTTKAAPPPPTTTLAPTTKTPTTTTRSTTTTTLPTTPPPKTAAPPSRSKSRKVATLPIEARPEPKIVETQKTTKTTQITNTNNTITTKPTTPLPETQPEVTKPSKTSEIVNGTTSLYGTPAPHALPQAGRTKPIELHTFRTIKNTELIHHGPPPTKVANGGPFQQGAQRPMQHGPDPMNRGPMNQAHGMDPMNRGHINPAHGPDHMNQGPMNQGPMNQGPMNQGPMNRAHVPEHMNHAPVNNAPVNQPGSMPGFTEKPFSVRHPLDPNPPPPPPVPTLAPGPVRPMAVETGPHPPMPDPRYEGQPGLPPPPRHGPDMLPQPHMAMGGPQPGRGPGPMDPYNPGMGPHPGPNQPFNQMGPMMGPDPRFGPPMMQRQGPPMMVPEGADPTGLGPTGYEMPPHMSMGPYPGPPMGGPHMGGPPNMGPPNMGPFEPPMYNYPPPPPGMPGRFRRFAEAATHWMSGGMASHGVHSRHRRAAEGHAEHTLLEELTHIFHLTSMAVLSFLVVVTILKIFSMGRKFIHHKLEVFDAFVVATSWALDVAFLEGIWAHPGPNAATILLFLLPWRVVRIVNSFVMVIEERGHVKLKLTKQKLRTADKKITGLKLSIERYRMETRSLQGLCRKYHAPEPEINQCAPMWKRRRSSSLVSMMEGCAKMAMVTAIGGPSIDNNNSIEQESPHSRRIMSTDSGVSSVSHQSCSYDDFRLRRNSSFTAANELHHSRHSSRRRDSDSSFESR